MEAAADSQGSLHPRHVRESFHAASSRERETSAGSLGSGSAFVGICEGAYTTMPAAAKHTNTTNPSRVTAHPP